MVNKIVRLTPANCVFFECDIQERLTKHIFNFNTMAHNAARMAQVSKILGIPVIATAQVNFGPISPIITAKHHEGVQVFTDKKLFSMLEPRVEPIFTALNRPNLVIYGCEAHICVKHTALDAIARGYNVHLVVDGISSMTLPDRNTGIQALRDAGAHITTF